MAWSNITKNLATWANATKHYLLSFLLMETGDYLLLETGDRIILDDSTPYTYQTKNTA